MMRLWVSLIILMGVVSFRTTAQAPLATPDRPVFTIEGAALYGDVGDGPVLVIENSTKPLIGVYTPAQGSSVILATDPNYNDTLVRLNVIYDPKHGFEIAGYTQISRYRFHPPVLFGGDGSIAFIEVTPAEQTDSGLPLATVILQENYDFRDGLPSDISRPLFPTLPVTTQEDGAVITPILRSYVAHEEDVALSVAEVELASGESLAITEQGARLAGDDHQAVTIHFPEGDRPYAQWGQTQFPLDIQGTYYTQTSHADGTVLLYTTRYQDSQKRYDWLYWVSLNPFKVREIIRLGGAYGEHTDPILEGDTALTPDGQTVLYTAYSDSVGASLWKINLAEQPPSGYDPEWDGVWYPTPVLLVEGLPFWADAGNFALPRFIAVTDSTVTLEAFSLEQPHPQLTYTLDGLPVERD